MIKHIEHNREININISNNSVNSLYSKYTEKEKRKLTKTVMLAITFIISFIIAFFLLQNNLQTNEVIETKETHIEVYLFIFNYHWNSYVSYPYLRDVYIPYLQKTFKNKCEFVFYGPKESSQYPIKRNGLDEGGYYSYYTLVKAYKDINKQYDGYFFLNDDSFFDPVLFYKNGLNLNYPIVEGMGIFPANFTEWLWPNSPNYRGITFRQAYINVRNNICSEKNSIDNHKFEKLCGFNENQNFHGYADFFYIPKSLIKDFVYLYDLAYKEGMFLEMAVNSFAYNYEYQELGYKCYFIHELGKCPHIHPIKYSYEQNRQITAKYIQKTLVRLNIS